MILAAIYLAIGLLFAVPWFCVEPERDIPLFLMIVVAWPIIIILWIRNPW